jgi:hypothetical protein
MLRALAVLLLTLPLPAVAAAQVELSLLGGYRFGGGVDASVQDPVETSGRLELDDAASFGVHLGYPVGEGEIEHLYPRQNTRLQTARLFTGVPVFDIGVETWQFGGSYYFGEDGDRVRPFIGVGLGLTRLLPDPAALDDENRFSASFGAGAKVYLARHFGLRFEARGFFTVLDSEGNIFCGGGGTCAVNVVKSDVISQADVRAGLIFRF